MCLVLHKCNPFILILMFIFIINTAPLEFVQNMSNKIVHNLLGTSYQLVGVPLSIPV